MSRAAGFPLLPALPRSVGSRRWGSGHDSVSMSVPLWPPLPLYSADPVGLGSPTREPSQGPTRLLDRVGGDQY